MLTQESWLLLCRQAGADPEQAPPVYELVVRLYGEHGRQYHTLQHVSDCLERLSSVEEFAENPIAVALALVFHDIVLVPEADDNEERSAELAVRYCGQLDLSASLIGTIRQLILDTKHDHIPETSDGKLIADIDLAGLALPYEKFRSDGQALRREVNHLTAEQYQEGESKFFKHLLAQKQIFLTPYYHSKLEVTARNNLEKALKET